MAQEPITQSTDTFLRKGGVNGVCVKKKFM